MQILSRFVLFPVLAGAHWKQVLAGGIAAAIVRNLIFTGLQTASSVGHEVSTLHATGTQAERIQFQIETSKNFVLGRIARVLCGGLDRHIEHDLYPHLPPRRLHARMPFSTVNSGLSERASATACRSSSRSRARPALEVQTFATTQQLPRGGR